MNVVSRASAASGAPVTSVPSNTDSRDCRNSGYPGYTRSGPKAPVRRYPDSSWCSIPHVDSARTERVFRRTLAGLGSCAWKPHAAR